MENRYYEFTQNAVDTNNNMWGVTGDDSIYDSESD